MSLLLLVMITLNATVRKISTTDQQINFVTNMNLPYRSITGYSTLLNNAPRIFPIYPLTTIESTSLEKFTNIISMNGDIYEIGKMGGMYYLAYPSLGTTFSIQVLSSPYQNRVVGIVNTLREESIPAFAITYGNETGLFVGVFPNYTIATEYASDISNEMYQTVGSTESSWLIRTIP